MHWGLIIARDLGFRRYPYVALGLETEPLGDVTLRVALSADE